MKEGIPKFEIGFISDENEKIKARIEAIRYKLMEIERKIMYLKIHPTPDSEAEISRLKHKQTELLAELQQLENAN